MRNTERAQSAAEKMFRALGDRHRLQILDLLMVRELNAGEILDSVDVVQSTLSHHMKTLCESGLVNARKNGKWTIYTVNAEGITMARAYLCRYLAETPQEETEAAETAAPDVRPGSGSADAGKPDTETAATDVKPGSGNADADQPAAEAPTPDTKPGRSSTDAGKVTVETAKPDVRSAGPAAEKAEPDVMSEETDVGLDVWENTGEKSSQDRDGSSSLGSEPGRTKNKEKGKGKNKGKEKGKDKTKSKDKDKGKGKDKDKEKKRKSLYGKKS